MPEHPDFDSNGIAVDAYGHRSYKRYAEFMRDGELAVGGIYIGQSTPEMLLVDLCTLKGRVTDHHSGAIAETWTSTGQLVTVPQSQVIRIIEPRTNGHQ